MLKESKMKITGSCYCGEIKYQAESQNNNALICHCSDCQRMSSGPFRAVIIAEPNSVVFTQGEPKELLKQPKVVTSVRRDFVAHVVQHFMLQMQKKKVVFMGCVLVRLISAMSLNRLHKFGHNLRSRG